MSKRLLVADDSDAIRRVVHTYLAKRDFDVCGEAAREQLAVDAVVAKAEGMERLEECVQRLLRT